MAFLLSSQNVFEYLVKQSICTPETLEPIEIKPKECKNFNLLVSFPNNHHLLVKQERHDSEGYTDGEFWSEWCIQKFVRQFPELTPLQSLISEAVYFDPSHSIVVFKYLNNYGDLGNFYSDENIFSDQISSEIASILATIHRTTLNCEQYKQFLAHNLDEETIIDEIPEFLPQLKRIKPAVFGAVRTDALEFFRLYQRYPSLADVIASLNEIWKPCCLIHNDLRLSNFLLHLDWDKKLTKQEPIIKLIDWEKFLWGDPAYDLATVIAGYLKLWLKSLVVNSSIDIKTALILAKTPLEILQPSIYSLTKTYLDEFPEILEIESIFFQKVMQFTGLILMEKMVTKLQYRQPFNNQGICTLQVAKTLLCNPKSSIPIIFGKEASEFNARI